MVLCSTGALIGRPNGRDYTLLNMLSEKLICDGFEFMMYSDWYEKADEIVKFVSNAGVAIPVYHAHFVFDTKMAAFHDQLNLLYEDDNSYLWKDDHICHYHVNDYGGGYKDWANLKTLPIGMGHIDFDEFFGFIRKIGYSGTFTLESTAFDNSGNVDTDMLNREVDYIREHLV